jgi:CpeT protein
MSQFLELLVGTFANKVQAQSHPTRYAHIRVSHRLIGENRIYGEQAYNYQLDRPYRQFVIDVVEDGEDYILKNYEILDAPRFITLSINERFYNSTISVIAGLTGKELKPMLLTK